MEPRLSARDHIVRVGAGRRGAPRPNVGASWSENCSDTPNKIEIIYLQDW